MKVSAIVGVKNEASLIEACLDHLLAIGVDQIHVQDYGSIDGTLDILMRRQSAQISFQLVDESQNPDKQEWGRNEAAMALSTGSDWVLFQDADEFWLPRTGSIKTLLNASSSDVALVQRYNLAAPAEFNFDPQQLHPNNHDRLLLFARVPENWRKELEGDSGLAWINAMPMPKIAIRPPSVSAIFPGHHGAQGLAGQDIKIKRSVDCVIVHVPFTTFQRFQLKLQGIRESLSCATEYHEGSTAWHWKRWLELEDSDQLKDEFQKQFPDDQRMQEMRRSGQIKSAAELLSRPLTIEDTE